jgi:hypothetical protein
LIDGNGGNDHSDGRALPVADVNAGFVDHNHRGPGFEDDAAGGRSRWRVAKDERALAGGLENDVLPRRNGRRCGCKDGDIGDETPEAAGPDG